MNINFSVNHNQKLSKSVVRKSPAFNASKNTAPQNEDSSKNVGKFKGYMSKVGVNLLLIPLIKVFSRATIKINRELTQEQIQTLTSAARESVENTFEPALRVQLKDPAECEQMIKNSVSRRGLVQYLPQKYRERAANAMFKIYANGGNAAYSPARNLIIASDKIALAWFHEIGHAVNAHKSKISKATQRIRHKAAQISLIMFLIALFNRNKEVKNGEELRVVDKSINFLRNNIGVLAIVPFAPKLIEEITATINGNKLAKAALSPELYKKVVKHNALAGCTYVARALIAGVSAWTGIKVKDMVQAKYDASNNPDLIINNNAKIAE